MRRVLIPMFLPEFFFRLGVWLALGYRKLRYGYTFRKIPLTQGQYAIVDRERYEEIARYKWFAHNSHSGYYALRTTKEKKDGRTRPKIVRMHWVVLEPPEGRFIDHINHNGLDNRRANLRVVTNRQNIWNSRKRKGKCSSKYKGVHRVKGEKKWRARIQHKDRMIFIGEFDDEKAAAKAYDQKAKELFGEYAVLNLKGD